MKISTADQYRNELRTNPKNNLDKALDSTVLSIINTVRNDGDQGLRRLTKELDGVELENFLVTKEEIEEAKKLVQQSFMISILQAKENIIAFHQNQKEQSWFTDLEPGITLGQKLTPIERVGIYIPGGKASYPSTVLMNVIPAKIAGVKSISIASPPRPDGSISPYVLVAASMLGVERIYKIGGAQAIAALAYGTETIEKVFKIVGPGNAYVARAKKWVYGDVAIDMIAGPSEICIVADETANPKFVAADLLSQAEHDEEASSICITTSPSLANKIAFEVNNQLDLLVRKEIAQASITNKGRIILVHTEEEAFEIVNTIAPEHLQLMIDSPSNKLRYIKNAGAIFLGSYSPEPLGDYLAGPNHTLPTNGTAKFSSPLGVYDFVKRSSIIQYSKQALQNVAEAIDYLASTEGLQAHANSIRIRKED